MADGRRVGRRLGLILLCAALACAATAGPAFSARTVTVTPGSGSSCSADGTTCTLLGAVALANDNPGTTIELPPRTYFLSGELELTGDGTTIRATAAGVGISAVNSPRAFLVRGSGAAIVGINIVGRSDTYRLDSPTDTGKGGAIDFHPTAPDGTLALIGVKVTDGWASYGGNIYQSGGVLYIADSEIGSGRARGAGGALYAASGSTTVLDGVFVGHNHADFTAAGGGGGIAADGATIVATNSTFVHNSASNGNGADSTTGGAFLLTRGAELTLDSVTVAGNGTAGGSEISADATSRLAFTNSILGTPQSGSTVCALNGASVVDDTALAGDGTCGLRTQNGSASSVDPRLLPFGSYGGPTQTMPPGPDSPAVDAANAATCPPIDQRYVPRPQGGGCDVGAVESPFTRTSPAAGGGGVGGGGAGGGGGGGEVPASPGGGPTGDAPPPPQPAPAPADSPSTTAPPTASRPARPAPAASRLGRNGLLVVSGRLKADPRGAITVRWTVRKDGKRHHGRTRVRSRDRVLSATVRLPRALRGARLVRIVVRYTDASGKRRSHAL